MKNEFENYILLAYDLAHQLFVKNRYIFLMSGIVINSGGEIEVDDNEVKKVDYEYLKGGFESSVKTAERSLAVLKDIKESSAIPKQGKEIEILENFFDSTIKQCHAIIMFFDNFEADYVTAHIHFRSLAQDKLFEINKILSQK